MPIINLKAYLINLERVNERREQMAQRLQTIGLEYKWFPAIEGVKRQQELLPSVDVAQFERRVGRPLLWGEIGCYHSHIQVWKNFLHHCHEEVLLVLEDDVVFNDDFIDALNLAMSVQSQWDFLKLNKIRAKQPISQGSVGRYHLNAYLGPATGLGAYLIRRSTIEKLLPNMFPITRPIDHELDRTHVHQFRHLGLEPFPSYVDDGNVSTITGSHFSGIKKPAFYKRLPHYISRLSDSVGKFFYLVKTRQILPKNNHQITKD